MGFLLVSILIFSTVPITANAETDNLGYEYTPKKASEIDFADGDFFIALLSGDPLSEGAVYAVYETSELERFEREHFGMNNSVATLAAKNPPTKFSDYYSKSNWRKRSDGITLSVYPKKLAWTKHPNPVVQAHYEKYRWQVVYNKHKGSKHWKNTVSMKAQLRCHAETVRGLKNPWNLEPWRKTSNYAKVVAKACNPK